MSAQEETAAVEDRPNVTVLETLDPPQAETPKTETPAAETEGETTAETETAAEDEGQDRDEKGRFKPKVQERIDELVRKAHEKDREAAYWRGIAESRVAAKEDAAQPQGKPTADQFIEYSDYVEALADWKAEQKIEAKFAEREAKQQETAKATTWQERVTAVKAEFPDFDAVMANSTAPMTHAMAEAIKESDMGPRVAIHLAQNPDIATKWAGLSPSAVNREIGRLEATLSAPKAQAEVPKRVTSAPTPPTPIGSGRSTTGDPAKMSQADYLAWRADQLKEAR
jgi:hypothetical protein